MRYTLAALLITAPVLAKEPILPPECQIEWTPEYIRSFPEEQWQELRRTRAICQNLKGQIRDAQRPKLQYSEWLQEDEQGLYDIEVRLVQGIDPNTWVTQYASVMVDHVKPETKYRGPEIQMHVHPRTMAEMVADDRVARIMPLSQNFSR